MKKMKEKKRYSEDIQAVGGNCLCCFFYVRPFYLCLMCMKTLLAPPSFVFIGHGFSIMHDGVACVLCLLLVPG